MGSEPVERWSDIRQALDAGFRPPLPAWLPEMGDGYVTAEGYHPVAADHLGPCVCMDLRAGDIIGTEWDSANGEWSYLHIRKIASQRTHRVLVLDVGTSATSEHRLPVERLFTSVWRPSATPLPLAGPSQNTAASPWVG
jgi:hypothetical protein